VEELESIAVRLLPYSPVTVTAVHAFFVVFGKEEEEFWGEKTCSRFGPRPTFSKNGCNFCRHESHPFFFSFKKLVGPGVLQGDGG